MQTSEPRRVPVDVHGSEELRRWMSGIAAAFGIRFYPVPELPAAGQVAVERHSTLAALERVVRRRLSAEPPTSSTCEVVARVARRKLRKH